MESNTLGCAMNRQYVKIFRTFFRQTSQLTYGNFAVWKTIIHLLMVHKCCGTILFFSPLNLGIQTEMYVSLQKIYNKMFNKNQYIDYPKTWFYLSRPPMLPQQLATWPGGLLCASLCLVQAWFMPWQAWLMLKSTVGKIKMSKILYSRVLDSRH